MADSRGGRRSFLFSSKFLLLCLYTLGYIALRLQGEIVLQRVMAPLGNGGVGDFRMVSANGNLPRWRQQLWRALFSPAMVIEEEGQPVIAIARELYGQAQQRRAGGGHGDRQRIVDQAAEAGRRTQYAQSQPRAASRGNPNGLDEGERMIFDPRAAGR